MAETSRPVERGFDDVLCYLEWWDCPRSGLARVDGVTMHFASPFDETLDDYVAEFYLWAATDQEVSDALEVAHAFAGWRARFDAGEKPPPFASLNESESQRRLHELAQQGPPVTALRAVPEWRLDINRSFVGRVPRHKVRWTFLSDTTADR
jgi:hypothetical protein